ncbi:hypothetical protein - conserved [Leishmania donovani]|uniref:Dymeclin n=1 Tax=Leishmania donovani TaxID=5661 RepID=A0A6J8F299_LEIDO|nr:hypothetical protein - conserved [Leishmania donovani]VDZ41530.1 Dyggve-Melchior-Clausen_syndrome_protein_putative/Pfam:PF09742 [Leishmania donovani]
MGAALRKEASEYFTAALTSDAAAAPGESEFLEKVKQYERGLCGGSELYGVAEPIAAAVMSKAAETGSVRWLLRLCSEAMRRCVEAPYGVDASTPAVLHLAEVLLRHILRLTKGQSAQLIGVLEAVGARGETAPSNGAPCEDTAALLCRMAFSFLVSVPLDSATVATHLEVLRLLLTMTSSALHHGTDFQEDTMDLFTELMMSSPLLGDCLAVLLQTVVLWGKPSWTAQSPALYHEGHQPSFLNLFNIFSTTVSAPRLASGKAAYVLDVPSSTTVNSAAASGAGGPSALKAGALPKDPAAVLVNSCSCWEQVGRHATALLCVLVVHQKGGGRNPALEYVTATRDGSPVSFVALLSAIRCQLTSFPELSILLYVLLHDHYEFLHTVLTEDAALLVSTLQQLLEITNKTCRVTTRLATTTAADAADDVLQNAVLGRIIFQLRIFSYPFINFMSSTLLLLVSQDRVVNRLLCNTPCLGRHVLERYDASASVGALAVVVLSRGIIKGLNERNEALIAVFAPCLVNLAPFLHDMDTYTAQRVCALLTTALKKIHRASALLTECTAAAAATTTAEGQTGGSITAAATSAEDAQALEQILAMYVRQLRIILEGVEALLRGADRRNEHLIYELLYVRSCIIDDVDAAVDAQRPYAQPTKQLLANLAEMIKNCEADIASSNQAQSPQEILAILRRGQQQQQQHGQSQSSSISGSNGKDVSGGGDDDASNDDRRNGNSCGGGGGHKDVSLSRAGSLMSAPAVEASIAADAMAGPDGASVDLVYSYEELPHSYDFFGPFVWATLLSAGQLPGGALWCRRSNELPLFPH